MIASLCYLSISIPSHQHRSSTRHILLRRGRTQDSIVEAQEPYVQLSRSQVSRYYTITVVCCVESYMGLNRRTVYAVRDVSNYEGVRSYL